LNNQQTRLSVSWISVWFGWILIFLIIKEPVTNEVICTTSNQLSMKNVHLKCFSAHSKAV
jgi:hypothetical protein